MASDIAASFLAGTCGALSAALGKLGAAGALDIAGDSGKTTLAFRVLCFGGVFLANVAMWRLYTRSLRTMPSLTSTVLNTSANLLCSGGLGVLFFNEQLQLKWVAGVFIVAAGLLLLVKGTRTEVNAIDRAKLE